MPRYPTLSLGFRQITLKNHGTHKEIPTPSTGIHNFQTPHKSGDRRRNPNSFSWYSHRHLKKRWARRHPILLHGGHIDADTDAHTFSWGSHRHPSLITGLTLACVAGARRGKGKGKSGARADPRRAEAE